MKKSSFATDPDRRIVEMVAARQVSAYLQNPGRLLILYKPPGVPLKLARKAADRTTELLESLGHSPLVILTDAEGM
jgi:hypothetical protein